MRSCNRREIYLGKGRGFNPWEKGKLIFLFSARRTYAAAFSNELL